MKLAATTIRQHFLVDKENFSKDAQVGIDITVNKIFEMRSEGGVYKDKSIPSDLQEVVPYVNEFGRTLWHLLPNTTYQVEFDQGIKPLTPDVNASIIQRSSLNRCGVRVQGSIYDPGFYCDNLGAALFVTNQGITIEQHARIAQLIIETNEPVDEKNVYNGQFQGKAN